LQSHTTQEEVNRSQGREASRDIEVWARGDEPFKEIQATYGMRKLKIKFAHYCCGKAATPCTGHSSGSW
jgi:hypothetical protein